MARMRTLAIQSEVPGAKHSIENSGDERRNKGDYDTCLLFKWGDPLHMMKDRSTLANVGRQTV
eukprot:scaffold25590_cov76-Amphora_coffeaeformis.AAC.1